VVRKRDKDEILPPTMSDQNLGTFRFKRQYRTRKRKKGTEFVYQIRVVPEGNLESNPVACSTTDVEKAMASGEEDPVASGKENPVASREDNPDASGEILIECAKEINHASLICGDNKRVILNCTVPDSHLKKEHVAIAYHKAREAAAAGIIHPVKINSQDNFADILTKAVTGKVFWSIYGKLTRGE